MKQLLEYGCVKISEWYLDDEGRVRLDYPSSLASVPGVLVIANADEILYIGATTHYGTRIKDFIHSINGDTTKARIHSHIADYLSAGMKDLVLWRKDDPSPYPVKKEMLAKFTSRWNR